MSDFFVGFVVIGAVYGSTVLYTMIRLHEYSRKICAEITAYESKYKLNSWLCLRMRYNIRQGIGWKNSVYMRPEEARDDIDFHALAKSLLIKRYLYEIKSRRNDQYREEFKRFIDDQSNEELRADLLHHLNKQWSPFDNYEQ